MKTGSTLLSVLLVVQLAVAGGLLYASHSNKVTRPQGALLEYDPAVIDRLEIAAGADQTIVLGKLDGQWQLPDNRGVPVQSGKVEALIESMAELETGWAVATKSSSHAQLEVAEADYQRRVKLFRDDQLSADLYIGSSPGMRRVHARTVDSDDVYSVALNSYDMPVTTADWLQKDLIAATDITVLTLADAMLAKQDDNWLMTTSEGEAIAVDPGKVNALTGALQRLAVQDIVSELPTDARVVTIGVSAAAGDLEYELYEIGQDYFVSRNDIDAVFSIQKADYESIGVSADDLKPDPPAADDEAADDAPASPQTTDQSQKE